MTGWAVHPPWALSAPSPLTMPSRGTQPALAVSSVVDKCPPSECRQTDRQTSCWVRQTTDWLMSEMYRLLEGARSKKKNRVGQGKEVSWQVATVPGGGGLAMRKPQGAHGAPWWPGLGHDGQPGLVGSWWLREEAPPPALHLPSGKWHFSAPPRGHRSCSHTPTSGLCGFGRPVFVSSLS